MDLTPTFALKPADQEITLPTPFTDAGTQPVGGFMASPGALTAGNVTYNSAGEQILVGQATDPATGVGVFIGNAGDGTYDFRAGDPSANFIHWDGSTATLTITGTITATAGAIGGFNIGADYIRDAANSMGLASTVTGADDVRFWAGAAFASRATAPFFVTESGAVTAADIVATGTINAQGGYLGAPTTVLNISTSGLDIGTTGHIQGGQSGYNTGTGFFLGYSGAAYKFSIGDPSGDFLTWDGAQLSTNKFTLTGIGTFGGDGSDGALSVSSGTTNVDLAGSAYVVKNYSSISITGTGVVKFINPHANGTIIILKSRGSITLTSSATPMLDASGCGALGAIGTGGSGSGSVGHLNGTNGNNGISKSIVFTNTNGGVAGTSAGDGAGGALPSLVLNLALYSDPQYFLPYHDLWTAAGGATGEASNSTNPWSWTQGNGGAGGGTLIVECAGSFNFTTTNGISVAGTNATASSATGTNSKAGGAGGGAGGYFIALYNSLIANSGTVNVAGGAGANAVPSAISCGGAGANAVNAGGAGNGTIGGAGATGIALVAMNTFYA